MNLNLHFIHGYKRNIFYSILFILSVTIISFSTGFLYDEDSFFTNFYGFYLMGRIIFYYWPFGTYYYGAMMSGFLINIPFALVRMDNAIVQEFSIKLPFLISMGLTAAGVYIILKEEGFDRPVANKIYWIFLLTPIVLYDAAFHGNGLIIALFFEVFSIVFLYKNRYYISAIFLAMASSSYLFPLFFIIPVLYYIFRMGGTQRIYRYLAVFSSAFLIGQGLPIMVYLLYGIPFSQGSILGGIAGISIGGAATSAARIIPNWGVYYLVHQFFGYAISFHTTEIIFVLSMIIPSIVFIIIKRKPVIVDLIEIFFIESLTFVIFGLNSVPQYLTAIAPFSILLFSLRRDPNHLIFLTVLTFFDIGAMIVSNTSTLFGFFRVLNPNINAYYIKFPTRLWVALYSLYWITLIMYLLYYLLRERIYRKNLEGSKLRVGFSDELLQRQVRKMFSYLLIFMLITIIIVAPGISHPPSTLPAVNTLMTQSYNAEILKNTTGESIFYVNMGEGWSSMDSYAKKNGSYTLLIPSGISNSLIVGNFVQSSILKASPDSIYSEEFHFPFPATFHGYFVVFGEDVTPFVYLDEKNPAGFINLTGYTHLVKTVSNTHNFFEVECPFQVRSGNNTISLKIPNSNAYLSTTGFNSSGATFNTLISGVSVHVNGSYVSRLTVNSSEVTNVSLSLYLSLQSSINVIFNGRTLGNASSYPTSFPVYASWVKNINVVNVYGAINSSEKIVLQYNPPLSFSPSVLTENRANFIIGTAFLIISSAFLYYILRFIGRSLKTY